MTGPRKIRIRGSGRFKIQKKWDYGPRDPASQGIYEWDGSQPWSKKIMSDFQQDQLEILEGLYSRLKGRDKQVLGLLLKNETNQTKIAYILDMKQPNVARSFRNIAKKLLKK